LVAASGAATLSVNFKDVPGLGSSSYSWKELYTGANGTSNNISFKLSSHDIAVVKVMAT
jgi:alpha-galactosidase